MADASFPRGVELVTGVIIENDKGEIFLAQSPKWEGKWILPGGHIEPGESILQAGVREGEEETGFKLESRSVFYWGELISSKDFHRPAHFVFFNTHCVVKGGKPKLDERELSSYQWIHPEEALALDLAESYRESIEAFIQYRK